MALSEGSKAVIKEITREVLCEYKQSIDEKTDVKIHLHSVECEVKKYQKLFLCLSSAIGGLFVAAVNWLIRTYG